MGRTLFDKGWKKWNRRKVRELSKLKKSFQGNGNMSLE